MAQTRTKKKAKINPEQYRFKYKLLESFKSFSGSSITPEQTQCAKDCLQRGGSAFNRYSVLDFDGIRQCNEEAEPDKYLQIMESAYKLLLKYTVNLLRHDRPPSWRLIRTSNPAFKARVDCMLQARDILRMIGYKVETSDSMCFPEGVSEPDGEHLRKVAADLLMAKYEVEALREQMSGPAPSRSPPIGRANEPRPPPALPPNHTPPLPPRPAQPWPASFQDSRGDQRSVSDSMAATPSRREFAPPPHQECDPPPGQEYDPPPGQEITPSPHLEFTGEETNQPGSTGFEVTPGSAGSGVAPARNHTQKRRSGEHSQPLTSLDSQASSGESAAGDRAPSDSSSPQSSLDTPGPPSDPLSRLKELKRARQRVRNIHEATVNTGPSHDQPRPLPPAHQPSHPSLPAHDPPPAGREGSGASLPASRPPGPAPRNPSLEGIKYPPSHLQHPQYSSDTRQLLPTPALAPPTLAARTTGGDSPPSSNYCSKCKCRMRPQDKVCPYCHGKEAADEGGRGGGEEAQRPTTTPAVVPKPAPRINPPTNLPTHSDPPTPAKSPAVVRASFDAVEAAVREHHRTQQLALASIDPTHLDPGDAHSGPDHTHSGHDPAQPSDSHLAAAPPQSPAEQAPPPIPPRSRPTPMALQHSDTAVAAQKPFPAAVNNGDPSLKTPPDPWGGAGGGAGGGAKPAPEAQQKRPQFVEAHFREKEEAWKRHQLSLDASPTDLKSLHRERGGAEGVARPEAEAHQKGPLFVEEHFREKEEAWKKHQLRQGVKPADLKPCHREKAEALQCVDMLGNMEEYNQAERERKKIQRLCEEGQRLLHWVKHCVALGYEVEEAGLAYEKAGDDPLGYLENEWRQHIQTLQSLVAVCGQERGESVGTPSETEARRFLVEADGDISTAVISCHQHRRKKVEELRELMQPHMAVTWAAAVSALCHNGMDVRASCWALQCEQLEPLYQFLFAEWSKVPQEEMKEIKELVKKEELEKPARCRMLMAEYKLENTQRAEMVMALMEEMEEEGQDYPFSYYVDAAKDYKTLEEAKEKFIKPCPICGSGYPIHEMVMMPGCTHSTCKDCFKGHFTVVIKDQGVKHFNCMECSEPDLSNRDIGELYLGMFTQLIKLHVDAEMYHLCQKKLMEFNLSKEPGFRWCTNTNCRSGFINDRRQDIKCITCPNCGEKMCYQCKRPWEEQHQGISCEEFAQWMADNDPEVQEQGLAAHLKSNGIECPSCHMRYDLARGGCMHFHCTQCPNEFCSGCGQSFKKDRDCGKFESCATKGLHAHHPRDCLYHLRDFSVEELQKFLKANNIAYNTDPTPKQLEVAREKARVERREEREALEDDEAIEGVEEKEEEEMELELKCIVMLQKETPDGLKDEECGSKVQEGHAGICDLHYKEYLVGKINQGGLDPVSMYETDKVKLILTREELEVPEKEEEEEEEEEEYRERLIKHVQEQVPLQRINKERTALQAEPRPPEPRPPPVPLQLMDMEED